jgi:Protein of unknown function (DUF2934)
MADGPEKKAGAKKSGVKKAGAKKASSGKKAAPAKKAAGTKAGVRKASGQARKAATSSPRPTGAPSHEQIAARAYERWEHGGGDAVENWLQAERDLSD